VKTEWWQHYEDCKDLETRLGSSKSHSLQCLSNRI